LTTNLNNWTTQFEQARQTKQSIIYIQTNNNTYPLEIKNHWISCNVHKSF